MSNVNLDTIRVFFALWKKRKIMKAMTSRATSGDPRSAKRGMNTLEVVHIDVEDIKVPIAPNTKRVNTSRASMGETQGQTVELAPLLIPKWLVWLNKKKRDARVVVELSKGILLPEDVKEMGSKLPLCSKSG
uniref:Uncharacterized protein n=1 Tax=Nelumbo nucifera TaxID=4432 RepID=A0A822YCF4_NELNU|nr:TPA_asm: hypothetical protein HUJ06_030143 [Nelumbo nucifera]